ncbi:MAG: T9SS type A sorting domain-containing protein [Bacteroidota bacterium]
MKQLLLLACLSFFTLSLHAQVFVDIDAAAGGDGTTWATAYNDLNIALRTSASGSEVWIAEGTYVTPDSVSFFIDKEMTVIGGFSGSETMASEADPSKFETILSGDVMGNDPVGSYDSLLYLDNNRVLLVSDTNDVSAYTVTLTNLTFTNGGVATDPGEDEGIVLFSGAGILSDAKLAVSNVKFTANRASFGSAFATWFSRSAGSTYDNITVEGNYSGLAHQVYIRLTADQSFTNSTFSGVDGEQQSSGFLRIIDVNDVLVENCTFSDMSTTASGVGVRAADVDDLTVRNCRFDNLDGTIGTGILAFSTDLFANPDNRPRDVNDHVIEGSVFNDCRTLLGAAGGAGIYFQDVEATVAQDSFINCVSPSDGGGLLSFIGTLFADDYELVMRDVYSDGCEGDSFGGAISAVGFSDTRTHVKIENTTINNSNCTGNGQGGAYYGQGLGGSVEISGSSFSNNEGELGGGVFQNTGTNTRIKTSNFISNGNAGSANRGAVALFVGGTSDGIFIDSCRFENNQLGSGTERFSGGSAVFAIGGDSEAIDFSMTNSTLESNSTVGESSGAGVVLVGAFEANFDHCQFFNNNTSGQGGSIYVFVGEASRDTTGAGDINVTLDDFSGTVTNSFFYGNTAGSQGGAISTQSGVLDLINNAFVLNQVGADGASGGAVIFNGNAPRIDVGIVQPAGGVALTALVAHNTFYDNLRGTSETAVGDHMAFYQPGETVFNEGNSMTVNLVNNAFFTTSGPDEDILAIEPDTRNAAGFQAVGDLTITSLGGNFFNGSVDSEIALLNTDLTDTSIEGDDLANIFVDADALEGDVADMRLVIPDPVSDNPLIDAGVDSDMAPEMDQDGNMRDDSPDIGAFEAIDPNSVRPVEESGLALSFFPNPTADVVNIKHDDARIQQFSVLVADQNGRMLLGQTFRATNNVLDLTQLPTGVYSLQLYVNGSVYSKQVVKQ